MKFTHIGWMKEGTHDKIWGIIRLTDKKIFTGFPMPVEKYLTFWGRRGAKLQTKSWEGHSWEADSMFKKKEEKGYKKVHEAQLHEVYPEFKEDLEKTAFWASIQS